MFKLKLTLSSHKPLNKEEWFEVGHKTWWWRRHCGQRMHMVLQHGIPTGELICQKCGERREKITQEEFIRRFGCT